jgi:transposase
MSRPLKAVLIALLLIAAYAVFPLGHNQTTSTSARANETLASMTAQTASAVTQEQLRRLLLERKRLLEKMADSCKQLLETGRTSISAYMKAKETALLAGLDLCDTKAERIEIRREIVELHKEAEVWTKRRAENGRAPQSELDEARVARLGAEIDLLKEQLDK